MTNGQSCHEKQQGQREWLDWRWLDALRYSGMLRPFQEDFYETARLCTSAAIGAQHTALRNVLCCLDRDAQHHAWRVGVSMIKHHLFASFPEEHSVDHTGPLTKVIGNTESTWFGHAQPSLLSINFHFIITMSITESQWSMASADQCEYSVAPNQP